VPQFTTVVKDLLEAGLAAHFTASGSSMAPAIADGDGVIVEPVCDSRLETGTVVLAEIDGRLLAHRIVGVQTDGALVLRGDNRASDDPPVARHAVRGVVTQVIRARRSKLGGWFELARSLLRRS
jgi:SOS-response transcriptional repressor LexA